MQKLFTLLAGLLIVVAAAGQNEADNIFVKVESESGPDSKKWAAHLNRHCILPDSLQKTIPAGTYKAVIKFVVDVHGNLGQFSVQEDPGYGLGKRAVSIIRSYTEPWRPASQCGRNVKSYKQQAIIFKVTER